MGGFDRCSVFEVKFTHCQVRASVNRAMAVKREMQAGAAVTAHYFTKCK